MFIVIKVIIIATAHVVSEFVGCGSSAEALGFTLISVESQSRVTNWGFGERVAVCLALNESVSVLCGEGVSDTRTITTKEVGKDLGHGQRLCESGQVWINCRCWGRSGGGNWSWRGSRS